MRSWGWGRGEKAKFALLLHVLSCCLCLLWPALQRHFRLGLILRPGVCNKVCSAAAAAQERKLQSKFRHSKIHLTRRMYKQTEYFFLFNDFSYFTPLFSVKYISDTEKV